MASGYTKVTDTTLYSSTLGYGWTSAAIGSRDRGTPAVPLRDLNFTYDGTFAVDLANGTYNVTLTDGDAGFMHDLQGIFLQGTQVDTITTQAGQFVTRTYQVTVSTGQLDLELKKLPGAKDGNCVINALVITSDGPTASAGPNLTTNEGDQVTFAGTASGGTAPLSYLWNFGDGTTASGSLTPSHVYTTYGIYTATLTVTDAYGMTASSSLTATVHDVAPTVNIGGPYQGNARVPVSFIGSATEPNPAEQAGLSYLWNFGDGSAATGANPSHAFAADGIYTVTLTVTNANGLSSQATTTLDIYPSVTAGLDPTVNEGDIVDFVGTAVGSNTLTYHWVFGDGSTADGTLTPQHVYTAQGSYTATLTVTDTTYGFSQSSDTAILVNDVPPQVTINGPSSGAVGSPLSFSPSIIVPDPEELAAGFSYSWNFGDGTTSATANPTHFFAQAGIYTVTLGVAAQDGATAASTLTVKVTAATATTYTLTQPYPASGIVGTASGAFTVALPTGQVVSSPVTITLNDSGAGGTFTPAQVVLSNSSPSATFTYTPAATGAITISSTNNGKLADPQQVPFFSTSSLSFDFGTSSSPVAPGYTKVTSFTKFNSTQGFGWLSGSIGEADRGAPAVPLRDLNYTTDGVFAVNLAPGNYTVTLTSGDQNYMHDDEGIYLEGKLVDTITAAAGQFVTHTYQVAVTDGQMDLEIKDLGGVNRNDVINALIIQPVETSPTANAGPASTTYAGQSLTFAGTAAGMGSLTYSWTFGDGSTSTGTLSPTHVYANPGVYTAGLTVTDSHGLSSQSTVNVTVNDLAPTVSATAPASGTAGTPVALSATATSSIPDDQAAGFTYTWNFGDGTTGTGASVSHTYARDGFYAITVSATDQYGTAGTATTMIDVFRPGHPGDHSASYYTITPPSPAYGLVNTSSSVITVSLPSYRYVSGPVTVTPNDGGAGGAFTPASVVLSDANPTATFTYTPEIAGAITIGLINNGGLSNPAAISYTSYNPVTTYTVSGPASGELGTTSTFTVTLGAGLLLNPVTITPTASNGDGTFSPSSVTLTWTNPTATFTYSAVLWGTRNIVTTNDGGLTNPAAAPFVSLVQLGSSGTAPSGNQAPDLGGFNFFTTGGWWQEMGRTVTNDAVAPNSASLLSGFGSNNLRIFLSTTTANGGNSLIGGPTNVVPGNQPLDPLYVDEYVSPVDPASVPAFPSMSIEGWYSASGTPPAPGQINGDHHAAVLTRNETTGGIGQVTELYQLESPSGTVSVTNGSAIVTGRGTFFKTALAPGDAITVNGGTPQYVVKSIQSDTSLTLASNYTGSTGSGLNWLPPTGKAGATWQAASVAQWDLTTGAPRPEGLPSSLASGLPYSPMMIDYGEAALAAAGGPPIDHPFGIAISPGLSRNAYVWPARSNAYNGSSTTGLPMGSRLRLSQSWYDANINNFDPITQAVVTAMYNYGLVVNDLASGGIWLSGINDQRWTTSEISSLAQIPDSAFEVLNTIQSPISFTGPSSGTVGVTQSYPVQYLIAGDSNFSANAYLFYSSNGGATWVAASGHPLNDSNRSFTLTFTPPAPGNYILNFQDGGMGWILPSMINFTATAAPSRPMMANTTQSQPSPTVLTGALTASGQGGSQTSLTVPGGITRGEASPVMPPTTSVLASPQPAGEVAATAVGLPGAKPIRGFLNQTKTGTKGWTGPGTSNPNSTSQD